MMPMATQDGHNAAADGAEVRVFRDRIVNTNSHAAPLVTKDAFGFFLNHSPMTPFLGVMGDN